MVWLYIYIHKSIELSIIDLSDSRLIQPLTNSIEQTISIRPSVDGWTSQSTLIFKSEIFIDTYFNVGTYQNPKFWPNFKSLSWFFKPCFLHNYFHKVKFSDKISLGEIEHFCYVSIPISFHYCNFGSKC